MIFSTTLTSDQVLDIYNNQSARFQQYSTTVGGNVTLTETIAKPTLEESIYWRAQAEYIIGDTNSAIKDYRETLRLHPNWAPAIQALQDLGIQP